MQIQQYLEIVYGKNHFNLTKEKAIQNDSKSECSRFEQISVIKSLWLRSANHVKFTEECVM